MTFSVYNGTIIWDKSVPVIAIGNDIEYLNYQVELSNQYIRFSDPAGYDMDILTTLNVGVASKFEMQYDSSNEIVRYHRAFGLQDRYYVDIDFFKTLDPYNVKIMISGTIPTSRTLELNLNSNNRNGGIVNKTNKSGRVIYGHRRIEDSSEDYRGMFFDWVDIISSSPTFTDDNKLQIPINAGRFTLDPSAGFTSTSGYTNAYTWYNHLFYDRGLWWYFYSDLSLIRWRTFDGNSWSSAYGNGMASNSANEFNIAFDKVNHIIHLVSAIDSYNQPILYRKGTLRTDGTIDWCTPAGVTVRSSSARYNYGQAVGCCLDSTGKVWSSHRQYDTIGTTLTTCTLFRNDDLSGTAWTHGLGTVPFTINTIDSTGWHHSVFGYGNGRVISIQSKDATRMSFTTFDPSAGFGSVNSIGTTSQWTGGYRGIYIDNGLKLHYVFMRRNTTPYVYMYRFCNLVTGTWDSGQYTLHVETLPTQDTWHGLMVDPITENKYLFTWKPATTDTLWVGLIPPNINTIANSVQLDVSLTRYTQAYSGKVANYLYEGRGMYVWMTAPSPYTIMYNTYNVNIPMLQNGVGIVIST